MDIEGYVVLGGISFTILLFGGVWLWVDFWHAEWYREIGSITFSIGLLMLVSIPLIAIFNYRRENNSYNFSRYDDMDLTRNLNSRRDPGTRKFRRIG